MSESLFTRLRRRMARWLDPAAEDDRLEDIAKSARRLLRHGHDFWEQHQHSPESDEMSAALTDLYMALKRHGLDGEADGSASLKAREA